MAWDNPDFSNLPVVIRWSEGGEKQKIEIHRDSIIVTESGIFGKKKWVEPVPAFKGVLLGSTIETSWRDDSDRHPLPGEPNWSDQVELSMVRWLLLVHPDNDKSLLICRATDQRSDEELREMRKTWKDAAHALGLPALEHPP